VLAVLRGPVVSAVARRLAVSVPLLFVVSALMFVLVSTVPGDPTDAILGPPGLSNATPEQRVALAHELGFDQPLHDRYWNWLTAALHGDLGSSSSASGLGTFGSPVSQIISQAYPTTLSLVLGALVISGVLGVALGIAAAVWRGPLGRTVDAFSMVGFAVPSYWLASLLIVVFAVKLGWLPATDYVPFSQSPVDWLRSIVLPVIALSALPTGVFAKYMRDGMLDALASEHVRMAQANGIPWRKILFANALKPASLQVVTFSGLLVVGLLSSTVFVERVFGLGGLGSVVVNAAVNKDLPVVEGVAVFFTLIVIGINLVIDLVYGLLSPKVRAV
jgi:peptide/nickel transport system permease protein